MTEVILILIGLVVGGAVGVYVGVLRGKSALAGEVAGLAATLDEVRGQLGGRETELAGVRAALESEKVVSAEVKARMEAARESFAEQRRQLEEMDKKLKESFGALSAAALKSNNEQFVTLAEAKMKPLGEQLKAYEQQIRELEKARDQAYGGLKKQVENLEQRNERLGTVTHELVSALRQSGPKGRWGEITLQRILELVGMNEHCDFDTQFTLPDGQRPDVVVHMPGGRDLAVDSKVSTSAYLDAEKCSDQDLRKQHLARFTSAVRNKLHDLSGKAYWKQFQSAPEFVVMFIPSEAFFSAAVSLDPALLDDGVSKKVLIASPTTLIALLLAVRHGWQQEQVAENAQKIAEAGRDLYDRLCTFVGHLDSVRVGIHKAAEAYNDAIGNWQHRTEPGARKLKELGAAEAGKQLPNLKIVDVEMREASVFKREE